MKIKRWIAAAMSAVLIAGSVPVQLYAGENAAEVSTEAQTAELLSAGESDAKAKEETAGETASKATEENEAQIKTAAEAPTEKVTEAPTEKVTEAPTEKVTEAPTEKVTETPTEKATEAPTEKMTEAPTEKATEAVTEELPKETQTEVTDSESETSTEGSTENTEGETQTDSETMTEYGTEGNTEANSEEISEIGTEYLETEAETLLGDESEAESQAQSESESESESEAERRSHPYLEFLEVYKDALGSKGTCELTRHEELDEEFGGTVYMTDYGSTWTSSSFFVAASLSEYAPDGADTPIVLSAYDLDGTLHTLTMKNSTQSVRKRFRITNTTIFGAGADGAKRAVYTITVGSEDDVQIYKIIVNRVLELSGLSCYVSDPLADIINEDFAIEQKEYTAAVPSDVESVYLCAKQQSQAAYEMEISDQPYEAGTTASVPLSGAVTEISLKLYQSGTYAGEEYANLTYESTGSYSLTIQKAMTANVEFVMEPEDAVVCLYDSKGDRVYPGTEQENYFEGLLCGNTYTYQVSAYGYLTQRAEFVPEKDQQITVSLEAVDSSQEELTGNEWWNYRNNEENNGVTSVSMPENKEETTQKWAVKLGGDWNAASTPPLLLGGNLYTAAGKFIYRLDKQTGEVLAVSEELKGSMSYALNSLTYAEGMIFAQIGNGQIQAVSATTLESLWISEPVGGQTLSPITYKDGYIYTGTWNAETTAGYYFCLSVTDEDPGRGDETKYCTWKYSHKGGFYWAGSYTNGTYIVFGSDDGNAEGNYSDTSILYSVAARSGILLDKIEGLRGDIRTSVVYENGYVYFATKGGYLYRVAMNADGTFGQVCSYNLGGMATASPVIYKGRIYVGVCGTGGQFNADGGHHFAVLTESADGISLAYNVPVSGYPQAAALLSTAYEHVDYNGDGAADGRVYLYFTFNAFPGGIYYFTDQPGQTSGEAELLFIPDSDQQQYCISPICVDSDGTLYYKNDSCYIMAVEANNAYLNGITVEASAGTVSWDNDFSKSRSSYELLLDTAATGASVTLDIPEERSVRVNGEAYKGTFNCTLDENGQCDVSIEVSYGNKKKTYTLHLARVQTDASLGTLIVSDSNQISETESYLALSPEFQPQQTAYTAAEYTGTKSFLNVYAQPAGAGASAEMTIVSGAKRVNRYTVTSTGGKYTRYAVYFNDGESKAVVNLKITAADKETVMNYQITLLRADQYAPLLTDAQAIRSSAEEAQIRFQSNESGTFWYQAVEEGAAAPKIDTAKAGQNLICGENRIQITGLKGKGADVYIWAADEKGNVSENLLKLSLLPYQLHEIRITGLPNGAVCVITDAAGEMVGESGGLYQTVDGNTYHIYVTCENYEDLLTTFTVKEGVDEYTFEMVCLLSQNANLKKLIVSSSSKYGSGILKLSPDYTAATTHYEAVYAKERSHLNLWLEAADEKASVTVYAVGGVKASTVNKDETISAKKTSDGHQYWEIYFEKGVFTANVRVCVKAEDGTVKNYFVKLSIVDLTAPVLSKVSASRISVEKASVVFKTSENGTYYYAVADKGAKAPKISKKNGVEVLEGTVTISLEGLTAGEKEVYVIMMDAAGNESETLVIGVPDSRTGSYTGSAVSGSGSSGQLSGSGTGTLKPGGTSADGSTTNLKVSTKVKTTYKVVSRPVSNGIGDGYVIRNGVKYKYTTKTTVNQKVRYLAPDGMPDVIPIEQYWELKYKCALPVLEKTDEEDTLPWEIIQEEIPETSKETESVFEEHLETIETAAQAAVEAGSGSITARSSGFSRWNIQWLDLSILRNQILLSFAGLGMCYLLFVARAVAVNRRRRR